MMRIRDRFKSPVSKVVACLEKSRDLWKLKYQTLKKDQRAIQHQMRALQNSRQKWRERAEQAERQLKKKTPLCELPSPPSPRSP